MGRFVDLEHRLRDALRAETGRAVREAVHAALREHTGSGWVGSFASDTREDGRPVFVNVEGVGSSRNVAWTERFEGAPSPAGGVLMPPVLHQRYRLQVRQPDQRLVSRFRRLDQDVVRQEYVKTPIWRTVYAPMEATDQLRILVYAGPRFVRWLGCLLTSAPQGRFARRKAEAVVNHSGLVARALIEAEAKDRAVLGEGRHVGILDELGRLETSSHSLARWLAPERRARKIAELVSVRDAERARSLARGWLDGWRLELTRMTGSSGARWLIEAKETHRLLISRASRLTPRQRQVGELLIVGATYSEIAKHVGVSLNTVKQHVTMVYAALDVASKQELVQVWNDPSTPRG